MGIKNFVRVIAKSPFSWKKSEEVTRLFNIQQPANAQNKYRYNNNKIYLCIE